MLESIRRVSATLFVLGVLVAGITFVASYAVNCPVGTSCLGAVFSYSQPMDLESLGQSQTTDSTLEISGGISDFVLLNNIIQSVSVYLLIVAAAVLIVLEIKELHYLKELSLRRKKKA